MYGKDLRILFFALFFLIAGVGLCCQCPFTTLSTAECDKYGIIFRGKITSVKPCGDKYGEAVFEVNELYKGNSRSEFTVLFDCRSECAMQFLAGEEWIIYSNYKQLGNAMMDWCSRSRKHFQNDKEDFYAVNYGNDYDDEVSFLKENLGLHRLLPAIEKNDGDRNTMPTQNQTILLFVCSLLAIILFYWLFNKFFKF